MNSTAQSAPSSTKPRDKVIQHLKSMGGMKRLTGMLTLRSLSQGMTEQHRLESAENAYIRRVWGNDQPPEAGDDMGDEFVAGDKTSVHHHHVTPAKQPSMIGKAITALALASPFVAGAIMAPSIIDALKPDPVVETQTQTIIESGSDRDWKLGEIIVE